MPIPPILFCTTAAQAACDLPPIAPIKSDSAHLSAAKVLTPIGVTPQPLTRTAIASPETLDSATANRSIELPPTPIPTQPPTIPAPVPATSPPAPIAKPESITIDYHQTLEGEGQLNRYVEPTVQFQLNNGDKLRLKTGFNSFKQSGVDQINNVPLQVGWEHKMGYSTLKATGGVDFFDRLSVKPNLNTQIEVPVGVKVDPEGRMVGGAVVSGEVDFAPYKFNARTLQNEINAWHVKPKVYWQIDRDTSFYAHYQAGFYNDGNVEHQTFSRLERKLGQFFVAANLFTWNYAQDKEGTSGYFSPQDFLTYNGEVGWEGKVFNRVKCRLSTNLGQQRLKGEFSNANEYHANCSIPVASQVDLNLGYGLSNVRSRSTSSSAQNQTVSAQLRYRF